MTPSFDGGLALFAIMSSSTLALSPGCSLLFESDADADTDADAGADAGELPEVTHNFDDGFGSWERNTSGDGACSLEPNRDRPSDRFVCCESGTGAENFGVIELEIPATRRIEVEFRLLLTSQVSGTTPSQYSPLVAADDGALELVPDSIANVNVYPDRQFSVLSLPGTGSLDANFVGPVASVGWIPIVFSVSTLSSCAEASATIGVADDSTVTLPFDRDVEEQVSHVRLGVFRQAPGAGVNRRCFDEVVVRGFADCE